MNDIHHIYRHRQYDNIHSWSSPPLLSSCLLWPQFVVNKKTGGLSNHNRLIISGFHQGKMQHVIIISQLIKSACPHLSRQGSLSNLKSLAYHRGLHYFSAYQIGLPPFVTTRQLIKSQIISLSSSRVVVAVACLSPITSFDRGSPTSTSYHNKKTLHTPLASSNPVLIII